MIVKQLIDEDFVNYKKPSMFIGFPNCSWKCEKECGERVCQNGTLATSPNIVVDIEGIVRRYLKNPITSAIVIGGLEPFDDYEQLYAFIHTLREIYKNNDDIVIYTGYYPYEIQNRIEDLKDYTNIIIKFGRFIPDEETRYDEILGVVLASVNQYAIKIS